MDKLKPCPKQVRTLCSKCAHEFEIKMEHNGMMAQSVSTLDNCPVCGTRNDTWLAVYWDDHVRHIDPATKAQIEAAVLRRVVENMNPTNGAGSPFAAGYRSAQRVMLDKADAIERGSYGKD